MHYVSFLKFRCDIGYLVVDFERHCSIFLITDIYVLIIKH